jgi:hypothetical protein
MILILLCCLGMMRSAAWSLFVVVLLACGAVGESGLVGVLV